MTDSTYKFMYDIHWCPDNTVMDEVGWYWIKHDKDAWEGPRNEWMYQHSIKYFKYLKKQDIVITAGANCGMYARMHSKSFKAVYAFEPDSLNFHCMCMNNQSSNVIKFNCALGDKVQLVGVYETKHDNVGMHEVRTNAENLDNSFAKAGGVMLNEVIVPMLTIDTLNLPDCDLIQLDVQGYEYQCLVGASGTIKSFHPVIVLEYGNDNQHIVRYLDNIGYKFIERTGIDDIFIYKEILL